MKNLKLTAVVLLMVSMLAMCINVCVLSQRTDSESVVRVDATERAVFSFSEPVELSLFVCMPEAQAHKLSQSMPIMSLESSPRVLGVLELSLPRPLEIDGAAAKKHGVDSHMMCGVSSKFFVTPSTELDAKEGVEAEMWQQAFYVSGSIGVSAPNGSLVVASVSSTEGSGLELGLYFVFLISLLASAGYGAKWWWSLKQRPRVMSTLRFYDAPIALIVAECLALGISLFFAHFVASEEVSLVPSFGALGAMMASHFVAFILIAGFYLYGDWKAMRKHVPMGVEDSISTEVLESGAEVLESGAEVLESGAEVLESGAEGEAKATQRQRYGLEWWLCRSAEPTAFSFALPVGFGIVLALLGAVTVLLAPLSGVTLVEMASQLTSTCFLSAQFAILAGVSEECLFRGVIQSSLEAKEGSHRSALINAIAILVTTFLFVLLHVPQSVDHLWALIPIALVSLVAGWLKLHYRSIFPAILLHVTYNATLLMSSVLA